MRGEYSAAWGPLEQFQGTINLILRIAIAGLILVTGYYVYGVLAKSNELFRGMTAAGQVMTAQDFQHQLDNMELLTKVLLVCSVVGILMAIGRYFAAPETGLALLVVGALFFIGMPMLIDNFGGDGTLKASLAKIGDPRAFLKARYILDGLIFLGAGAVFLAGHAISFVAGMGNRRPRANADAAKTAASVRKSKDVFLGPCWSLPFCRDTEKQMCPIRQSRKPCWRTGRGCYCDQNVILQLSGGNTYAASQGSAGYLSRVSSVVARPKTRAEKREQCLQCPVYLHHQAQKYKLLAPLSLLGIIGFFAVNWALIQQQYPQVMTSVGRAASGFSFGPSTNGVPAWANDMANNPTIMWMLLSVAVVLALSYVLHAVEWVLYRLGA